MIPGNERTDLLRARGRELKGRVGAFNAGCIAVFVLFVLALMLVLPLTGNDGQTSDPVLSVGGGLPVILTVLLVGVVIYLLGVRNASALQAIEQELRDRHPIQRAQIDQYRPLDTTKNGQRVALTVRVDGRVRSIETEVAPLHLRLVDVGRSLAVRQGATLDLEEVTIDWDQSFEWSQEGGLHEGYRDA